MSVYNKEHGDGNPNFTLDQFDQEEMKAVPAVFRDRNYWNNYINKLNDIDLKELESKIYTIKDGIDKKLQYGDAKMRVV